MKDNQLEVGDVLYQHEKYNSSGLIKYTVERVTNTQAILQNDNRVKKTLTPSFNGRLCAPGIGDTRDMYLTTPELDEKYNLYILRNKVRRIDTTALSHNLNKEQLTQLLSLVESFNPHK